MDESSKTTHNPDHPISTGRKAITICIVIIIALIHILRVGSYLHGTLFTFYYSYFSDIVIPFGMYFLLYLSEVHIPLLQDWRVKAISVFGITSSTEIMQAFGVPILGLTFDPLDFLMFGGGVLLAVIMDRCLLNRLFPY
ncbi:hypothetical protein JW824_00285 [bacterium]|nr:hypothetical protein [bacterium]RQV99320.1 MAG: hypothetical protein EH221_00315 [bacterium]